MASTKLIPVKPVVIVSVTFLLWSPFLCGGTLSKSSPKKAKQKSVPADAESSSNSPAKSVFDRGLVKEKFKINDLITHHSTVCQSCVKTRQFSSGMALAYVTPWNNRGYDIAKDFANKFTHLSPVWLQLKFVKNLHLEVTGTHDIDANWMKAVRRRNKNVKIVPRMLLDGWSGRDYVRVFASEDAMTSVAKTVADFLQRDFNGETFDGVVFETNWLTEKHRGDLVHLLTHVVDAVRKIRKEFILVVPPSPPEIVGTAFGAEEFRYLRDSVDYFSVMTYDYPMRPGPNAPIEWIKKMRPSHCGRGRRRRRGESRATMAVDGRTQLLRL